MIRAEGGFAAASAELGSMAEWSTPLHQVLSVSDDSRLRGWVTLRELIELQRGRAGHREFVDVRGKLALAVEHVVKGNDLPGVCGHAAHGGDEAGLGPSLHFVVKLVFANGMDQVVPFDLV